MPVVQIRLRSARSLPAAGLLLAHVYGRPLDWCALPAPTLTDLVVLAHDLQLPALKQACVARLMHNLAALRPAAHPGAPLAAAIAAAPPHPQPQQLPAPLAYVATLAACVTLPPDVAAADACVPLGLAVRTLLLELYQDVDAAWQVPLLRRTFTALPLPLAVELLSSDQLCAASEAGPLLAALWYDTSRGTGAAGAGAAAGEAGNAEGPTAGEEAGGARAAPLSTPERLALYGAVRWAAMYVDPHSPNGTHYLVNAMRRAPHLRVLLEHAYTAMRSAVAMPGAVPGLAPTPLAVPELMAAAAACAPTLAVGSLPGLSQLVNRLVHGKPTPHARPRPTGHARPTAALSMELPYEAVRTAVERVAARLVAQEQRIKQAARAAAAGAKDAATPPPSAIAVEEDVVSPQLVYLNGYYWQMVVSLGPMCRYRMERTDNAAAAVAAAQAASTAHSGRPTPSPAAMAAAAAAAAHRTDTRLVCFVGVRPLLLLTEEEVQAATGRAVPAGWAPAPPAPLAATTTGSTAAAAPPTSPLLPHATLAETLELWNERDVPSSKVSLGPTTFTSAGGFRGTTTLFAMGEVLRDEAYWARQLCPPGVLRVSAKVASVI